MQRSGGASRPVRRLGGGTGAAPARPVQALGQGGDRPAITPRTSRDQRGRDGEMDSEMRDKDAHRLSLRSRLNQMQRLVGLLTRASTGASGLPGATLQWRNARTLGTYSGGAVPES